MLNAPIASRDNGAFNPANYHPLGSDPRLRHAASNCLPVRFPDCECALCEAACPVGAIRMESGAPTACGECIGCGQCVAACPTAALQTDGFTLPGECPTDADTLFIDCWRVPLAESPPGAWRVPCLGGIDTGWLLALFDLVAERGERPIRLLDRGACAGCPAGAGRPALRDAVDETRALLTACGVGTAALPELVYRVARQALAPAIPTSAGAMPLDRRGFLRGLAGGMARTADHVKAASTSNETTALRHGAAPIARMRVATALSRIAARRGKSAPARSLPQISISPCDAHGICARVCPTGALQRHEQGGAAELRFFAALCIACGQCARVCPDRAVQLAPEGGRTDVEVVARWQARECVACGEAFFGADASVCPGCIKQDSLQQGLAALFRPTA